jgi:hypothetical protein
MRCCYLAMCVLVVVSCVSPARAGAVGYFFIEASDGPHPGEAAAFLLFVSPPAEPGAGWTTSNVADIADFRILDSALGTVGVYTPQLVTTSITSTTGSTLDSGVLNGGLPPTSAVETGIDSSPGESILFNLLTGVSSHGDWLLGVGQTTVPEPSSLVMATMAATAGVVMSLRRRQRS